MSSGRIPSVDGGIQPTIVDAKGDLIVATAADTVSRLAVGSNDQVLTADSSTSTGLKWATAAAGGMTSLASGSLSGSTLTISSISSSYNNLQLVLKDYYPSVNTSFYIRFNSVSTGTQYQIAQYGQTTSITSTGQTLNQFELNDANVNQKSSDNNATAILNILDYANADTTKVFNWQFNQQDNSSVSISGWGFGTFKTTGAITSITILLPTGTMNGSYVLYGVK